MQFKVIKTFAFFFLQHKYHTKIDDLMDKTLFTMKASLVEKLISVLKSGVLDKLGRYDEGTIVGSIFSFTVSSVLSAAKRESICDHDFSFL